MFDRNKGEKRAKNLTLCEDGLALVIDKPVLEMLGINRDTPLEISTDGETLIVTPVRGEQEKFREALDKTNQRYGKTLKKLAE